MIATEAVAKAISNVSSSRSGRELLHVTATSTPLPTAAGRSLNWLRHVLPSLNPGIHGRSILYF